MAICPFGFKNAVVCNKSVVDELAVLPVRCGKDFSTPSAIIAGKVCGSRKLSSAPHRGCGDAQRASCWLRTAIGQAGQMVFGRLNRPRKKSRYPHQIVAGPKRICFYFNTMVDLCSNQRASPEAGSPRTEPRVPL